MARRPFITPDALVVVSSDGYFDVFPTAARKPNAKPAYRGVIAELGPTVRGQDGRLSVRPDSAALAAAVSTWSREHGEAAVTGKLGRGRSEAEAKPAPARPAADAQPAPARPAADAQPAEARS
jgi:hypothetical protein